jgi:hypothetical protein
MRKYSDDGKYRPRDFDGLTRFVLPSEKEKVIFGIFLSVCLSCKYVCTHACMYVCLHSLCEKHNLKILVYNSA